MIQDMEVSSFHPLNFTWHPHAPYAFTIVPFMFFYIFWKLWVFPIFEFFWVFIGFLKNLMSSYRIFERSMNFYRIFNKLPDLNYQIFQIHYQIFQNPMNFYRIFKKVWVSTRFFKKSTSFHRIFQKHYEFLLNFSKKYEFFSDFSKRLLVFTGLLKKFMNFYRIFQKNEFLSDFSKCTMGFFKNMSFYWIFSNTLPGFSKIEEFLLDFWKIWVFTSFFERKIWYVSDFLKNLILLI